MNNIMIKVSRARTALKVGLKTLQAKPGQFILLPDYCCDVLLHPLKELGLKTISYEVLDDLSPNWNQLNQLDTSNVFGIIMVHFFGQPQDIEKFQNFCTLKNIYLIEDNAHGFGGVYKENNLGTFGDIGISSPRKILNIPLGGVLYLKRETANVNLDLFLKKVPLHLSFFNYIKFIIYGYKPLYKKLLFMKLRKYDNSDPYAFKEKVQSNNFLSYFEKQAINRSQIKDIASNRRKLWLDWSTYLTKKGLKPVHATLAEGLCPWVIAFYAEDISHRNSWIEWGLQRNLSLFCWPSLPDEEIQKRGLAFRRWEKIICVGLDDSPPTT
tara:strand:- start:16493 stop:17467 length:975 start_codon:yes stop_codon:yes gene_type:complete